MTKTTFKNAPFSVQCNEDDESQGMSQHQIHLPFFEQSKTLRCVKAYLDEGIKEPKYYRPLIQSIESLNEGDAVYLSINSYGGYLDGAVALINAMRSTDAEVHVCIDGMAASAASMIALAAPSISVSPYANMMIHSATFGSFGKQSDVISHAQFVDSRVKKLMSEVYMDFLSEEEFAEVLMGREIWLNAEEIIERLDNRSVLQEKRYKKMQAEAKKAERVSKSKSKIKTEDYIPSEEES